MLTIPDIRVQNPFFDGPFTTRVDPYTNRLAPEIMVPFAWEFYYVPQGVDDPPWKHRRPEWVQYQNWSKMFVTSGTMTAGLMQRVIVNPGEKFSLEVGACYSSTEAGIGLRVGIDPMGGTDFTSPSVAWGPWQGETSKEAEFWPNPGPGRMSNSRNLVSPIVVAPGPITIFLHAENMYAGKDASAFWDSITLWEYFDEDPGPGPDPNPDPGPDAQVLSRIADAMEAQTEVLKEIRDRLPPPVGSLFITPTWEHNGS